MIEDKTPFLGKKTGFFVLSGEKVRCSNLVIAILITIVIYAMWQFYMFDEQED